MMGRVTLNPCTGLREVDAATGSSDGPDGNFRHDGGFFERLANAPVSKRPGRKTCMASSTLWVWSWSFWPFSPFLGFASQRTFSRGRTESSMQPAVYPPDAGAPVDARTRLGSYMHWG